MEKQTVHIIGAGPASLVAAINLARNGIATVVHEQKNDVGLRFHGDFQGIENWSTSEDVPDFLKTIGISINFRCEPFYGGELYGPKLRKVEVKSTKPVFYLVERGPDEHSLDWGLKQQALELGVRIQWNDKLEKVEPGVTIVGTGPKAADVIAKGIVFQTSHPDGYYVILDDRIAPRGYTYLLVNKGKGTFAVCLFDDFKHERMYFEKALETMKRVVDIDIQQPREFGGFGNYFLGKPVVKGDRILYVGETAGFQDALWGFGMRYAMLSGFLAAQSMITGRSYETLCREKLRPMLRTSLANRWIFAHLGNYGYERFVNIISKIEEVTQVLQNNYQPVWFKQILFQVAKRWYHTRLVDKQCMHQDCDCVWCRFCKH